MTSDRSGFTLVELLIVAVLGLIVVLSAGQILISNRQAYTAQTATVSGQQTTRMAVEVLFAELRELKQKRLQRVSLNARESVVTAVDNEWGFVVIGAGANSGYGPGTKLMVV